jgi:protein-arginine kinase activator protein McsA
MDGLRIMLQRAIENEEYEAAAKIRDEIKKMQNSI